MHTLSAIDQGLDLNTLRRVKEPTGLVVGASETDGRYNILDHPQNKTPRINDDENLRDARPDTRTSYNW